MRQIGPDFWEWDMPDHRVLGVLALGRRMTVARLPNGQLWVHSPIAPTPSVRETLASLGEVAHLIGPNTYHDAYLPEAQQTWPSARLHGAPGLAKANRRLRVDRKLTCEPPEDWRDVFQQHLMRGMPLLNEVVFLHPATRTLIIADLAFNLGPERPALTRWFLRLYGAYGRFAPSRAVRFVIKDRASFRQSLDTVLSWDFDRILIGHGTPIDSGGKDALRRAYAWL